MGGKKKITITVDDVVYENLLEKSSAEGFTRLPNFIRWLAIRSTQIDKGNSDNETVTILVDGYSEVVNYVQQKKIGNISTFANFAMEQYMQRAPLTQAQKERIGKSIE